jgi:predicted aspartyl protease
LNQQVSSHFPFVAISVGLPDRQNTQDFEIEAMVDTGFDGSLILPVSLTSRFGLHDSMTTWRLGDGSLVNAVSYDVDVQFRGLDGAHRVVASLLGDLALIGRGLTDRFLLILDHGRQLTIEA